MLGARPKLALIGAVAIVTHIGVVALMLSEARRLRPPVPVASDAWRFDRSPTTRPRLRLIAVSPPPPPVELPSLGEKAGTGESIASVDLPNIARSPTPHDFEQAWTRQHPTFAPPPSPTAVAAQASKPEPAPVKPPALAASPSERVKSPEQTIAALPFGTIPLTKKSDGEADRQTSQPPAPPAEKVDPTASQSEAAQPQSQSETQQATAAAPAGAESMPTPQGPSDLDAFAKDEGVDLTAGGIKARKGREVKLVRPRVDLGFIADATAMYARGISVTLRVETDATGRPRDVTVTKGSGSDLIDDAVRAAAFESWFGSPMPDRFPFTVRFVK